MKMNWPAFRCGCLIVASAVLGGMASAGAQEPTSANGGSAAVISSVAITQAPQRALTFSAFFHTVRLLGGQAGVAAMGHFIVEREKVRSNLLGLHVQSGSWVTDRNLHGLTAGLAAQSSGIMTSTARAAEIIGSRLRLQAYSLTYVDAFRLIAWVCAGMLLVTAVLRKAPMNFAQISMLQQKFISNQRKSS